MKPLFHAAAFFVFTFPVLLMAQSPALFSVNVGSGAGSYGPTLIPLDNSRFLLAGHTTFGFDSSHVKLVWLDHNFNVLNHKQYKLTNPNVFVFHAAKHSGGFLIALGENGPSGQRIAMLRTDTAGNVTRYDNSTNPFIYQSGLLRIVPTYGGKFAAYTYQQSSDWPSYRIAFNPNDTVVSSRTIDPVANNVYFTVESVAAADNTGSHLLCGGIDSAFNRNGLIVKLDTTDVLWARQYDFGNAHDEESFGVVKLANGNFAFTSYGAMNVGDYYTGYLTVIDPNGGVVWSKKLSSPTGFYCDLVHEMPNGELLLLANTGAMQGVCVKLSANGMVLWKKAMTGLTTNVFFQSAFTTPAGDVIAGGTAGGNFFVMKIEASGSHCALANDVEVIIVDHTPAVTPAFFIMAPSALNFTDGAASPRTLATLSSEVCTGYSGAIDMSEPGRVVAFPVPADDVCFLRSDSYQPVYYTVTDLAGREVLRGWFVQSTTLSIAALHHGVFMLRYTIGDSEGVIKLAR